MKTQPVCRVPDKPLASGTAMSRLWDSHRRRSQEEEGFTLLELLLVTAVIPLIIGALAGGLFAMFSLQSSVSNRLSDTADSQAVQASFRTDVQSAARVTTASSSSPQCGSGDQLLGLEWDLNAQSHAYEDVVSYVDVAVASGASVTYSLVRESCTLNALGTLTPVSSTTITSDLQSGLQNGPSPVQVTCNAGTCDPSAWMDASQVATISFPITEPKSSDAYTLVAAPATNASAVDTGGPISVSATAGCGYAAAGSGTYASSLCLVDLTSLTGNNMIAAEQGCLEVSVPLPGGSTMYFCIGVSGAPVAPYALPTWTDGFLGNSINGVPFYSDVPGKPALYQSCEGGSSNCTVNGVSVPNTWGGKTIVTINNITVVAPNGSPATGWEFVSSDAESTDGGESITWTTGPSSQANPNPPPLYLIPNGETVDTASDPIGNACNSGAGVSPSSVLTGSGSLTIACSGVSNGVKTGTAMVEALTPTSLTTTLIGTGLEGVAFGLLF